MPRESRDQALHSPLEGDAVHARDRLADAHGGSDALVDAQAKREGELLFHVDGQRLGHDHHELAALDDQWHQRALRGHLGRDQRADVALRDGQLAGRCERQAQRLGQQLADRDLVEARHLEQVGDEVAAVDHLPCERLLHLSHGRDLALDDEGA